MISRDILIISRDLLGGARSADACHRGTSRRPTSRELPMISCDLIGRSVRGAHYNMLCGILARAPSCACGMFACKRGAAPCHWPCERDGAGRATHVRSWAECRTRTWT